MYHCNVHSLFSVTLCSRHIGPPIGCAELPIQVIGFTGATLGPGYEDEWPSTTMVNWWTGDGNVRYWVLKLLIDNFAGESVNKTAHVTSTRSMGSMEQQKAS